MRSGPKRASDHAQAEPVYLGDILARIHDHKITRLDELLPWNWSPLTTALPEAA